MRQLPYGIVKSVRVEKDKHGRRAIYVFLKDESVIANNWDYLANPKCDHGFHRRLATATSLIDEAVCWTTYKPKDDEKTSNGYSIKCWFRELIPIPREHEGEQSPFYFEAVE